MVWSRKIPYAYCDVSCAIKQSPRNMFLKIRACKISMWFMKILHIMIWFISALLTCVFLSVCFRFYNWSANDMEDGCSRWDTAFFGGVWSISSRTYLPSFHGRKNDVRENDEKQSNQKSDKSAPLHRSSTICQCTSLDLSSCAPRIGTNSHQFNIRPIRILSVDHVGDISSVKIILSIK